MRGLKPVANRRTDALAQTHWAEVEHMLAEHYRRAGYEVEHCGTGATGGKFDGGVDLKLRRADERIVVQCKHWNAMKVAHNDVHQLLGIMVNEGATGAILVTSGEFTKAAIEAATKQGHVQLIDGDKLRAMLGPLPMPAHVVASAVLALEPMVGMGDEVPQRVQSALNVALMKLGMILVMLLVIYLVATQMFGKVKEALQPKPSAATSQVVPTKLVPVDAELASPGITMPPPPRKQTPEEIREAQRKADEAMKVIEASTPEI